ARASGGGPRRSRAGWTGRRPGGRGWVGGEDAHRGTRRVGESLNTRGGLPPPVRFDDLVSRISAVLPPGDGLSGPWPRLGESVGRSIAHLSRHYDEDLTVESIAEIAEISASHLAHLFRSEAGMSVRDYLTRV